MAIKGVTYNVGEVEHQVVIEFVRKFEREGIDSQLQVSEKEFFSHVMVLRRVECKGIRKVVDFRLLNAYAKTLKIVFCGTLVTLWMVPSHCKIYISIDLSKGYFHIPMWHP